MGTLFYNHSFIQILWKTILKNKYFLISFSILPIFFIFVSDAHAQTSIADTCGQSTNPKDACTLNGIPVSLGKLFKIFILFSMPLLVVFIAFRMLRAYFLAAQGNAGAYKDAIQKSGWAVLGFIILVIIIGGGLMAILSFLGFKPDSLKLLQLISDMTDSFIPYAYAQEKLLPNPTTCNDFMDCLNSILRTIMRFFIYPGLIAAWVWTGFSFIKAQGAPEDLAKAKKLLLGAFLVTFIIFTIQGFVLSLQATAKKVIGDTTSTTDTSNNAANQKNNPFNSSGTGDMRTAPSVGAVGSSCQVAGSGAQGIVGQGGVCYGGRGGGTNVTSFCIGKSKGTACSLTGASTLGLCNNDTSGVSGCYAAQIGEVCLLNGIYGKINDTRTACVFGGERALVGLGGSCRVDKECEGTLVCGLDKTCTQNNSRSLTGKGGSCRINDECATGLTCRDNSSGTKTCE